MQDPAPPQYLLRLLKSFCKREYHPDIEGDLLEFYERRRNTLGKAKADWLLFKDVVMLFRPGLIKPMGNFGQQNNNSMIRSYIKISWRSLQKSKLYAALNVLGLTFGIVWFLLIGLYVFDEMTFDQQHTNAERIYRVIEHKDLKGEKTAVAAAGYKLAEEAKNAIPEVEMTTRVQRQGRANLFDPENPVNFQETITVADENFLRIFDFPLISGDRRTALKEPNSIIISEDLAMRIFNSVNVVGKTLQFNHLDFPMKITGVFKNHPTNSSFTFSSVMSESSYYIYDSFQEAIASDWVSNNFSVYALLTPHADPAAVSKKMTILVLSNFTPELGAKLSYTLQCLTDVHLHSANIVDGARNSNVDSIAQGNPVYVKVFSFVAIFVLLIAGINYVNLTTARASSRIKEIGVRKTIGAMRGNLVGQFLTESLMTTVIALLLAVIVVYLLLPSFNNFAGKQLSLAAFDYRFWLISLATIILVGLLSGSYVAMLLSRFNPVLLLKGLNLYRADDLSVRKGLVIFQFTISTVMIIGTIVLVLQTEYLRTTDLGFNKDLMVVIDVNVLKARSNFESVKNEMEKVASVKNVSVTSRVPGEWKALRQVKLKGEGSTDDLAVAYFIGADKDFLQTYEISLLKGRNFSSLNDSSAVLINETAARLLGMPEPYDQILEISAESDGGPFSPLNDENVPFKPRVVGIVKDFHFQSLRDKIQPLIIAYNVNPIQPIDYYSVNIAGADVQGTLNQLKAIMVKNDEEEPFEYHFLDSQLALFYLEDNRRQSILTWVAFSTVIIACLGLFGLATYAAEQRLKEVTVRKILGANVSSLVSLLSKDFIKLVLLANCIAIPIGWWVTNRWLQEFAYHVEVGWWIFLVAAVLATAIALLTVSYQAVKTAFSNPVKSLRAE